MDAIRLEIYKRYARRGRGFGRTPPVRDRALHAESLRQQLQTVMDAWKESMATRDPSLPPVPQGVQILIEPARDGRGAPVLTADAIPAQSWKLEVAEERQDGMLVTLLPGGDASAIKTLVGEWERNARDPNDESKALSGTARIGHVERFARATRSDRMGDALAGVEIDPAAWMTVDVELRAGHKDEDGPGRRGEFRAYVAAFDGTVREGEIVADDYAAFRATLPGRAILDLLDNWWDLLLIDLPPRIEREALELQRDMTEHPFPEIESVRPGAPVIGIIDGGVVSGQPLLQSSLAQRPHRSWVPSDPAVNVRPPAAQHGCAVAGIAALGSLRDALVRDTRPIHPLGVCVARVLDAHANFPEELNLPAKLSEIVEHLRNAAGVRIVNHSLGSTLPFRTTRMSVWAERIDHLTYDEGRAGVLFIVAAGNLDGKQAPTPGWLQGMVRESRYPGFLLDERCRVQNPAQAINALTVGGYVPEAGAPWTRRAMLGLEPIARDGEVSPLSRSGPGYMKMIKPELVEESGNYYRTADGNLNTTAQSTDVAVANSEWQTSGTWVRFDWGTSFAAPKVAHLAGRVAEALPTASPDLLRALLVNSAEWPTTVSRAQQDEAVRLYGYGVPRASRIFEIHGPRSVVVIEDMIPIGHVDYFVIPFPRDIFPDPTRTTVRVSITLAYRAPVRRTNKRYRGTVLEWALARRGESFERLRERISGADEEDPDETNDDDEAMASSSEPPPGFDDAVGEWSWTIGSRLRTRGTVQKDWFNASAVDLGDKLLLAVLGRRGWMSIQDAKNFKQRYAVALSIESVGVEVPLHESIKARVRPKVPSLSRSRR